MKTTNEPEAHAYLARGTSRVLIVEDDPELLRALRKGLRAAETRWSRVSEIECNFVIPTLDEDSSIRFDSYKKLPRYDKGLVRRRAEWQLKKVEWQLTRDKILVFAGLALTTFLVLIVSFVLVFGSLSGGMQISLILACSALITAMLRHFRHLIDGR